MQTPFEITGLFPKVPAIEDFADALMAANPSRVSMQFWGAPSGPATRLGMFTVTVGTGPSRIAILSSVHGSEPAGTSAAQALARDLAESTDPGVAAALATRSVTFMFLPNPYGINLSTRHNGNDVDLNRGYDTLAEPEHVAIDAWLTWAAPVFTMDLHELTSSTYQVYTGDPATWTIPPEQSPLAIALDAALEATLSASWTWGTYTAANEGTIRHIGPLRWKTAVTLIETSVLHPNNTPSVRVQIHETALDVALDFYDANASDYMAAHLALGGSGGLINRRRGAASVVGLI